jgi:prefoldin subunit 5
MNEQQAREKGYEYTGYYERFKDKLTDKLEAIRKAGFKAVIVTVPDSPYSRGIVGVGYAIYVEHRYNVVRTITELEKRIQQIDSRKAYAFEEYQKALIQIEKEEKDMISRIVKLQGEM